MTGAIGEYDSLRDDSAPGTHRAPQITLLHTTPGSGLGTQGGKLQASRAARAPPRCDTWAHAVEFPIRSVQSNQEEQMTATKKWKMSKDPLFRGDTKEKVCVPNPRADDSIVRHVMYFEGPGRETPYLSTSEDYELAENFSNGAVWETLVKVVKDASVGHISRTELLSLMKGNGKGKAKWQNPFEVMQARRYVEQWGEHLLDFRDVENPAGTIKKIFKKS